MTPGARRAGSSSARAAVLLLALVPPLALRVSHAPRFLAVLCAAVATWLLLEWIGVRLRRPASGGARADLAGLAVPAILLLCLGDDIALAWLAGGLLLASLMRHGLGGGGLAPFHPGLVAAALVLAFGGAAPPPHVAAMPAACALALVLIAWRGGGRVVAPLVLLASAAAVVAPARDVALAVAGSLPVVAAFVASDPAQSGHRLRTQWPLGMVAGLLGSLSWLAGVGAPWPAALLASQAALPWLEARDARRRARAVASP